jgi:multiple sugar transport system substrate-binding protein
MASSRRPTRRQFLKRSAGLGAALTLPLAAPALSQSKPFQGQTLNVSCWNAPYPKLLQEYLPEFEALTGMKVNYDTPGFLIYNQRIDLELSTKGSAYDVLNITFIYVDRWVRSGWFHPLGEFVKNQNSTPKDWDVDDFLPAARSCRPRARSCPTSPAI